MPNCCIIGGGSGGGVLLGYWHERTSLFVGYVMEAQESPSHYIFLGETARPQIGLWRKIRVNPNYLVVFFTGVTPNGRVGHAIDPDVFSKN